MKTSTIFLLIGGGFLTMGGTLYGAYQVMKEEPTNYVAFHVSLEDECAKVVDQYKRFPHGTGLLAVSSQITGLPDTTSQKTIDQNKYYADYCQGVLDKAKAAKVDKKH